MSNEYLAWITLAVFGIAFLYSSVGHAGASGYIAVLSLFSVPPNVFRPLALTLNILVAGIGTWQFYRAGHFRWRVFWPFALLGMPLAFAGGRIHLPGHLFQVLVGLVLVFSAARFLARPGEDVERQEPSAGIALLAGGALGFLAGLTGTGGGIFLTPLLLLLGWARTKTAAATSAAFILVNSVAGLAGNLASGNAYPSFSLPMAGAAAAGGFLGSWMGSRRFDPVVIKRLLAVVLAIAGTKLILV